MGNKKAYFEGTMLPARKLSNVTKSILQLNSTFFHVVLSITTISYLTKKAFSLCPFQHEVHYPLKALKGEKFLPPIHSSYHGYPPHTEKNLFFKADTQHCFRCIFLETILNPCYHQIAPK